MFCNIIQPIISIRRLISPLTIFSKFSFCFIFFRLFFNFLKCPITISVSFKIHMFCEFLNPFIFTSQLKSRTTTTKKISWSFIFFRFFFNSFICPITTWFCNLYHMFCYILIPFMITSRIIRFRTIYSKFRFCIIFFRLFFNILKCPITTWFFFFLFTHITYFF